MEPDPFFLIIQLHPWMVLCISFNLFFFEYRAYSIAPLPILSCISCPIAARTHANLHDQSVCALTSCWHVTDLTLWGCMYMCVFTTYMQLPSYICSLLQAALFITSIIRHNNSNIEYINYMIWPWLIIDYSLKLIINGRKSAALWTLDNE